MATKIRMLTEASLNYLKQNIKSHIELYQNGDLTWLKDYFLDKQNTFESKINDANIELKIPVGEDKKEFDAYNAELLYKNYPDITPALAADERLWASLCNGLYFDYMRNRWPAYAVQTGQTEENIILQRYFFAGALRKSQERNGLSRLWLCARMTFDSDLKDQYSLTKIMLSNTNFPFYLLGHGFGGNRAIVRGTLKAIQRLKNEAKLDISSMPLKEFARRLNLIGGASVLDNYPEEWFIEEGYKFMSNYVENNNKK